MTHKQQEADVRASAAASALAAASADARSSKHHGPKPDELANLNVIVMSDVLARAEAAEKLVEAAKERAYNADRENARLQAQLTSEQGKTTTLQRRVMARPSIAPSHPPLPTCRTSPHAFSPRDPDRKPENKRTDILPAPPNQELEAELHEVVERCQGLEEMTEESVGGSEEASKRAREAERKAR